MRPCREVPVHFVAGSKQREQCGERLFIPRSLQTFEALRGEKIQRPKVKLNSRPHFCWSDFFLIIFKYKKSQNKNVYFGSNFQQNMLLFFLFFSWIFNIWRKFTTQGTQATPTFCQKTPSLPFWQWLELSVFVSRAVRQSHSEAEFVSSGPPKMMDDE